MKKELYMKTSEIELINKFSFTPYGENSFASITVSELMKIKGECIARTENSGSEGYYCEIARWNPKIRKYQRFAHHKFLGGEIPDNDGLTCATKVTDVLNLSWDVDDEIAIIHHMDDWGSQIDITDKITKIKELLEENNTRIAEYDNEGGEEHHYLDGKSSAFEEVISLFEEN